MDSIYCFQDDPYRKKLFSPLKSKGFVPQKHSELFIGGIPSKATIHDLRDHFEKVGGIYEIKLMTQDDGVHNRGFGYVTFMNSDFAQKALTLLKTELFMDEAPLSLRVSVDNCRIFVGGVPPDKTKDQIWNALKNVFNVQNIVDVITYRNYANPAHNRGFVFLEFRTHEEASYFRAKYADKLVLFGKPLKVCWAIPTPDATEEDLDQIKILFIRNLDVVETVEEYANFIHKFIDEQFIEKIYKFKDYAYVHLKTREHAKELLAKLKDFYQKTLIEVTFAHPPTKFTNKKFRQTLLANNADSSNSNVECRKPLHSIENLPSTSSNMTCRQPSKSSVHIPSTSSPPIDSSILKQLAMKNLEYIARENELNNIKKELISLRNGLLSAAMGESSINVPRPLHEEIADIPSRMAELTLPLRAEEISQSHGEGLLFNHAEFEEMVNNLTKDT